jgi:hypothetical protein
MIFHVMKLVSSGGQQPDSIELATTKSDGYPTQSAAEAAASSLAEKNAPVEYIIVEELSRVRLAPVVQKTTISGKVYR